MSHSPNSPFDFSHLSHGVLDRYDLFPPSLTHNFALEAGPEHDRLSTSSDPEMMPSSAFHGITHHSNYAGDLIFGTHSHRSPASRLSRLRPGFWIWCCWCRCGTWVRAPPSPEMHTPADPRIDEIELAAINLSDGEPEAVDIDTPMDAVERKPQPQSHPHPASRRYAGFSVVPEDILNLDVQHPHQAHPFVWTDPTHRLNTTSRADHFWSRAPPLPPNHTRASSHPFTFAFPPSQRQAQSLHSCCLVACNWRCGRCIYLPGR